MTHAASSPHRTGGIARVVAAAALLAAAAALIAHGGVDTAHLGDAVRHRGIPAPLLVVGGCAVLVCAFVPRTLLAFTAGTILGGYAGTLWTVVGVTAGAGCAYAVGGFLGRDAVATRLRGRAAALDRLVAAYGPWAVAAARMLPVAHFGASNYLFGTTSVRWSAYVAGTAIGVAPGTAAYAALGASVASGSAGGTSAASVAAIGLSGLGIAGSALLMRLVARLPRDSRDQCRLVRR